MEYEKNVCPVLNVDGILATGKQFDLEITLPEDNRSVIYGIVKDCYHEPVCNAVVKLVEVVCECGKEERRPVSHTFTDENGEFVFGPLCANRFYEIEIWVDFVKHCKICKKVERDVKCLKGIKIDCKHKEHDYKDYDKKYEKDYEKDYDKKDDKEYEKDYDKKCEKEYDKNDDKGRFSEDKTNEKRPLPEEIRALPIEKQMEYVLEEMDKDVSIHQEFKPPAQVKEVAPEHPISHLVFVYIPQRGCAVCALPTIHA